MFEPATPRQAAATGLLAFIPVIVYGVTHSLFATGVTTVNLVIIFSSLYIAMSPVDGGPGHDHAGDASGTAS
ncbi:hypothetical protein [Natrinema sp. J7-1]|uniref:hypothetical protein n=1 Tax=Natrinema sp. J7-1 TaxID=1172566 RepID=UPI0006779699|nr:hypothetical protein [Natrinema sp. J7-1]